MTLPSGLQLPPGDKTIGHWLPWAWCNLRRNPFGELTRQERIELAVVDRDSLAHLLGGQRSAIQFLGGCGRGKTTRMLVLSQAFRDSVYVYLAEDEPCPAIPSGCPLLIDEAQRLPAAVRKRVFAVGLPLALATHRDLSRPLARAGYRVHTEHLGRHNDPTLVCDLLNRRIDASRLSSGAVPRLTSRDAGALVARFGSDIRSMEDYLYERVQTQKFSHGEMRFID